MYNYSRFIRFMYNDDPGAGGGGGGTETVESLKAKLEAAESKVIAETTDKKTIIAQRDKLKSDLKAMQDAEAIKTGEFQTLYETEKQKAEKLEADLTKAKEAETKLAEMETNLRNDYMEQLSNEHKTIAALIPTIEGLKAYVKINSVKPPPAGDPGRPGGGQTDYTNTKWDDIPFDDRIKLEKDNPAVYKRLYKEKYGMLPA